MNSIDSIVKNLRLNESDVGAFYVIGDHLYANAVNVRDGEDYGNYINYSSHWDLWRVLCRQYPQLNKFEYDDLPRGRVVFDKKNRQFIIYMDSRLDSDKYIDMIKRGFSIGSNYRINSTDEHYTSISLGDKFKLGESLIIRKPLKEFIDCDVY